MSTKIWVYYFGSGGGDGYVRLKLKAGQTLHISHGGPDDEGWHRRSEAWSLDDGVIRNQVVNDGVDCDGRLTRYEEYVCPVEDRHSRPNIEGWLMPAWETAGSRQRDYSAEAMGY